MRGYSTGIQPYTIVETEKVCDIKTMGLIAAMLVGLLSTVSGFAFAEMGGTVVQVGTVGMFSAIAPQPPTMIWRYYLILL